jgi:hypothetical protein
MTAKSGTGDAGTTDAKFRLGVGEEGAIAATASEQLPEAKMHDLRHFLLPIALT